MVLIALLLFAMPAFADYRTYEIEALRITVDTDWATTGTAGYFPVRLDITNLAEQREIEIDVSVNHWFDPSRHRGVPARSMFGGVNNGRANVRQRVPLKRGDRVKLTLPIPVTADSERLQITFREDGRNLDSSTVFAFQSGRVHYDAAALIVSTASSGLGTSIALRPITFRPTPYRMATPSPVPASTSSTPRLDFVLEPSRLPTNWLGYTALRSVILGPAEWKELSPAQQDALLTWTASGGDLIFADGTVDVLLPPGQTSVGLRKDVGVVPYFLGNIHLLASAEIRDKGLLDTINAVDNAVAAPDWSMPAVRTRDWGWMGERNFRVPIDGVGHVPTRAYLVILTLFVALIGPVNYIYLWRRGQQVLLVLTVPLISAAFILLLSGYGILSQGFGVRARAVTFTVLDQNSKKAATRASVSLFPGGILRSGGVRFSTDTAVFPLGSDGLGVRNASVDLTGEQRFTSGLLDPRTPSNFEQVWSQPARQRLNFERNGNEFAVVNGLGSTLKNLSYREGGIAYALDAPVAAGERGSLRVAPAKNPDPILVEIREGIKRTPISPIKFQSVVDAQPDGSYIAIVDASPFWDPGLEKPEESGSLHVVLGFAGGQP